MYKLDSSVYCLNSPYLFLSVFGTETIIYNNWSIDILDTFQLLYFVQKMQKYPPDVNVSDTCIDTNLKKGRKTGPRQLSPFPVAGMMHVDNTRNCPLRAHYLSQNDMNNPNRESLAQFKNRIKPRVYVRRITRGTMYEKVPFC